MTPHNTYSDKYRGVEYKQIKLPPTFILNDILRQTEKQLEHIRTYLINEKEKKIKNIKN